MTAGACACWSRLRLSFPDDATGRRSFRNRRDPLSTGDLREATAVLRTSRLDAVGLRRAVSRKVWQGALNIG
jgi:hypothetical protein